MSRPRASYVVLLTFGGLVGLTIGLAIELNSRFNRLEELQRTLLQRELAYQYRAEQCEAKLSARDRDLFEALEGSP